MVPKRTSKTTRGWTKEDLLKNSVLRLRKSIRHAKKKHAGMMTEIAAGNKDPGCVKCLEGSIRGQKMLLRKTRVELRKEKLRISEG